MSHLKKLERCAWVPEDNLLYKAYHDEEWGVPVHEEKRHFEFLILEGAQAGLSWLTVLKRRQEYRKAFDFFDTTIIAEYDQQKIAELLQNPGIIRNKLKVHAAIKNAKGFLAIQKEFGSFDSYVWSFVDGKTIQNHRKTIQEIPPTTLEAQCLSKDLIKRGFTFVGPTIMYAYMQAVGLVNDHTSNCFCYQKYGKMA